MDWLNYHHLLYFWTVVREGGFAKAAARLRLSHPTVSAQVRTLEDALGQRLLQREGRRVVPTETGRLVYRYADEIFALGRELLDAIRGAGPGRLARLRVGVVDAVPKLVALDLLAPARKSGVELVVTEGSPERLVGELVGHALDVIVSDAPVQAAGAVRAFSHPLGESGTTFFAAAALAARVRRGFPGSLESVPLLLPTPTTALRRALDAWLAQHRIRPRVIAEVEDSALLESFGEEGDGVFPAPTAIEEHVARNYRVQVVGRAPDVRARFYAITAERKLAHPAVIAIREKARSTLFG